jgi:hypothetical protein
MILSIVHRLILLIFVGPLFYSGSKATLSRSMEGSEKADVHQTKLLLTVVSMIYR